MAEPLFSPDPTAFYEHVAAGAEVEASPLPWLRTLLAIAFVAAELALLGGCDAAERHFALGMLGGAAIVLVAAAVVVGVSFAFERWTR